MKTDWCIYQRCLLVEGLRYLEQIVWCISHSMKTPSMIVSRPFPKDFVQLRPDNDCAPVRRLIKQLFFFQKLVPGNVQRPQHKCPNVNTRRCFAMEQVFSAPYSRCISRCLRALSACVSSIFCQRNLRPKTTYQRLGGGRRRASVGLGEDQ